MKMTIKTASGSEYEINGLQVRRVTRSKISASERVGCGEWMTLADDPTVIVGEPMILVWGMGTDQYSDPAAPAGVLRTTITSRVMSVYAESV